MFANKFRIDPRIKEQLAGQKRTLTLGLICSATDAALATLMIPYIYFLINAVESKETHELLFLSLGIVVLFGIKYWFSRGQSYFLSKGDIQLAAELRKRIFSKLQRLPITYFNSKRSGAIQSVLTHDVNVFQNAISAAKICIEGPIKILFGLINIFIIEWKLAISAMLLMPLMIIVIQNNAKRIRSSQKDVQNDLSTFTAYSQEAISGIRIVKTFGAEQQVQNYFENLIEKGKRSQLFTARKLAALRPTVELLGSIAIAIAVLFCGQLIANNQLTVAGLTAFLLGLDTINQGARNLGALNQTLAQMQAASDRIYQEVLDAPETMQLQQASAIIPENPRGRIEFRDVSFQYPNGDAAIKNVNFIIEPGKSLALVGHSGAGKSTISDLILKFYEPTEGQILFDDIDIQSIDTQWLRHQIGMVPQQTFLFSGSIHENLLFSQPVASEVEIWESLEAAHAKEFVSNLPNQLNTQLGERGVRLSGGEGQRIAIARALLRKPRLLILDEATSNLDPISEQSVQQALDEIMKNRTSLFIAHRLSTAARADNILLLSKGEVLEYGSHQKLLQQEGVYAGMYRAFSAGAIDANI